METEAKQVCFSGADWVKKAIPTERNEHVLAVELGLRL
jgi:hypothetical protein